MKSAIISIVILLAMAGIAFFIISALGGEEPVRIIQKIDKDKEAVVQGVTLTNESNAIRRERFERVKGEELAQNLIFLDGGYATDGEKIYYFGSSGSESGIQTIAENSSSFDVLSPLFAKDETTVYFLGNEVKEFEPESFRVLHDNYVTDGNNVYYVSIEMIGVEEVIEVTVIVGADPETFEVIDETFATDEDGVFYLGEEITVVDITPQEIVTIEDSSIVTETQTYIVEIELENEEEIIVVTIVEPNVVEEEEAAPLEPSELEVPVSNGVQEEEEDIVPIKLFDFGPPTQGVPIFNEEGLKAWCGASGNIYEYCVDTPSITPQA